MNTKDFADSILYEFYRNQFEGLIKEHILMNKFITYRCTGLCKKHKDCDIFKTNDYVKHIECICDNGINESNFKGE